MDESPYRLAVLTGSYVASVVAIAVGFRVCSVGEPNHGGKDGTAIAYSWFGAALLQFGIIGGVFQGKDVPISAAVVYALTSFCTVFGFIAILSASDTQGVERVIKLRYFNEATRQMAFRFGAVTVVVSILILSLAALNSFPFGKADSPLPLVDAIPYQIRSTEYDPGPIKVIDGIQVLVVVSPESYGAALPERFSLRGEFLNGGQTQWELMEASTAFIGDPNTIADWLREEESIKQRMPSDERYVEYHVAELLKHQMGNFESDIKVVAESENPVFPSMHNKSKATFTVLFPYSPPTETILLQLRLAPIEGVVQRLHVSDFKEGRGLRMTYLKNSK